ncbi:MAG: Ig domain-containing protein [Draconibacterium sp.]|nr:Ig domain-containing protein [Draconibacterium sp.]
MNSAVKVHVTPTGIRIITSEDDLVGKILVYEWCPTGDCSKPICSVTVDSVTISPSNINLIGNDTTTLSAHVYPDSVCIKNVSWRSSDNNVATVDYRGKVISLGLGSAWIKATSDMQPNKSDSVLVTVANLPVTGFALKQHSIEMPIMGQFQLTYTIEPIHTLNKKIIWESDSETTATVDAAGKVTAVAEAQTLITARTKDGDIIDTCIVTVYSIHATNITIIPSGFSLWVNDTLKLRAQIEPDITSDKTVSWVSLNPEVAAVNTAGILEGIAVGQAKIVVSMSDNHLHDTCTVNVVAASEFANRDIGNPCAPGNAVTNNGSVTVTASGDDIYNNQDQFHMVYKQWTGDGQIIAKIVNWYDSEPWQNWCDDARNH